MDRLRGRVAILYVQLPMNMKAWVTLFSGLAGQDVSDIIYCAIFDGSTALRNTDASVVLRGAAAPPSCD